MMKNIILFISLIYVVSVYAAAKIAYIAPNGSNYGDIWVMEADGSNPQALTNTVDYKSAPDWSPNGALIAFHIATKGSQVYTIGSNGSNMQNISNNSNIESDPDWSPDGNKIVFVSDGALYIMDASGGNREEVWTGSGETAATPDWSSDATKILFGKTNASKNNEIWVINADGTNPQKLGSGTTDVTPTWSPDGSKIAFAKAEGKTSQIYVMNADGSSPVQVTNDANISAGTPTWLPDGSKVAFVGSNATAKTVDIYTVDPDGNNLANFTNTASVNESFPDWSSADIGINNGLLKPYVQYRIVSVNVPNPFSSFTQIQYSIPAADYVAVSVYDNRGTLLRVLEQQRRNAGIHTVTWDGKDNSGKQMAGGQYYYKIVSGSSVAVEKMIME
jgi:Tol biopolymer transport system component